MTNRENVSAIGDLTVLGFTKDPERLVKRRFPARLGIAPITVDFGTAGQMFFYTTYGEVAESKESIALKLGFVRSLAGSPLSAQQLLRQKIVAPGFIDDKLVRGNALIVCLGKTEPMFSAFKTILSVPQFYFSISDTEIIGSDRLKCLVKLLDHVELDEDMVPLHFLFRSTPGDLTYYRQIKRLLPGQFFRWDDGHMSLKLVQDFRAYGSSALKRDNHGSTDILYEALQGVVGDCLTQVEKSGQSLANLLSGGVDSSLLQFLINQGTDPSPSRSFSYAVRVPSFEHEIEYAKQSSQLFHTEHTFVDFRPEDFPGLLTRAIDALAQPPILETGPSMLSIAEFAEASALPARYFISGLGADTVFGLKV